MVAYRMTGKGNQHESCLMSTGLGRIFRLHTSMQASAPRKTERGTMAVKRAEEADLSRPCGVVMASGRRARQGGAMAMVRARLQWRPRLSCAMWVVGAVHACRLHAPVRWHSCLGKRVTVRVHAGSGTPAAGGVGPDHAAAVECIATPVRCACAGRRRAQRRRRQGGGFAAAATMRFGLLAHGG